MNCEEAENLISSRIDGEITRDDDMSLDAHLAGCEVCRRRLSDMESQDAAMLRAFAPRKEIAVAVANRVASLAIADADSAPGALDRLAASPQPRGTDGPPVSCAKRHGPATHATRNFRIGHLAGLAAAAAIGFIAAIALMKPSHTSPVVIRPAAATSTPQPIAHLTLATGEVFTCPADQHDWREMGVRDPIDIGTTVRTAPSSKCELQLSDGSCVRLDWATEACFTANRTIHVSSGQVWSATARDAAPLHVSAGKTNMTATILPDAPGTRFDLRCAGDSATLCVQSGSAQVKAGESLTTVHAGQVLRAPSPNAAYACTPIADPLLTAQWQDELLLLKPVDDPDLSARIDQLLAQIAVDRMISNTPAATEQTLRAQGPAWCASMACYIRAHPKANSRQTAARLLADLAPAASVPDLIGLLDDADGEVRLQGASALHRLTGLTLGYSPDQCAASRDPAVGAAWREWWKQNKSRYPVAENGK